MVNVDFEEQEWQPERPSFDKGNSKMIDLILKTGLVKDPKKANYVLIVLACLFFIFTIYMVASSLGGGEEVPIDAEIKTTLPE